MYENRRWLVIPISKINDIDFTQVMESNSESLRKSIDGTLTFVKYNVNIIEEDTIETFINAETLEEQESTIKAGTYGRPSVYSSEYTEYNHADILELLDTDAWTNNDI